MFGVRRRELGENAWQERGGHYNNMSPDEELFGVFSAKRKDFGKINKLIMEDPSNVAPVYFPNDAEIAIAEQRYQEVDLPLPLPLPRPLPPNR